MNTTLSLRSALAALALLAAAAGHAQTTGSAAPSIQMVTIAAEGPAGSVVLPTAAGGRLTMPTCATCAPKDFQTTAATKYSVGDNPATVVELRAAALKNPAGILTVNYNLKSGVVLEVSATP